MTNCNDCGALLIFVKLRTGKAMPCTAPQDPTGNVAAMKSSGGGWIDAFVITKDHDRTTLRSAGYTFFRPHFADCEHARKKPRHTPPPAQAELFT